MKHIDKGFIKTAGCMLLSVIIGGVTALFFFGKLNIVWWLFIGGAFFLLASKWSLFREKRQNRLAAVFSVLLSVSLVIGNKIKVESASFAKFSPVDILYFVVLALLLFVGSSWLLSFIEKKEETLWTEKNDGWPPLMMGGITMAVIILAWLPYFLRYYPGSLTVDSMYVLGQAVSGFTLSDWHPFTYTLLVRLFVNIGLLLGDITAGVALFTVVQMLFMAATLSYGVMWLAKKRVHRVVLVIVAAYFALSPVFAVMALTMWKDVSFAALVLLYSLHLYDIIESRGEKLFHIKGTIRYILLGVLTGLMRHNGYYIIVLTALVLLFYYRRRVVRALPALLCSVVLVPAVQQIYYGMGVEKPPFSESLSVPIQQIVRTVEYGGELTAGQQEAVERFFDTEKMKEYNPFIADPAKNSVKQAYMAQNTGEFLGLWASMLLPNFKEYCRAYTMLTYGYWNPMPTYWIVMPEANAAQDLGVEKINFLEKITHHSFDWMNNIYGFLSIGSMVWMVVFAIVYIIYKKRFMSLPAFLPVIGVWGTLMVATPVYCEFRYILALPLCLPFLLIVALKRDVKEAAAGQAPENRDEPQA